MRVTSLDQDINYLEKAIPHHKCSEEEIAQFYPVKSESQSSLDFVNNRGGFNCIDWDDEDPHLIFGDRTEDSVY